MTETVKQLESEDVLDIIEAILSDKLPTTLVQNLMDEIIEQLEEEGFL